MTRKSKEKASKTGIVHDFVHDRQYQSWITEISQRYRACQIKAAIRVNNEMIKFYWSLGQDIISMKAENRWGTGFYKSLSTDLQSHLKNVKGLSPTNLKYMKYIYELFSRLISIRPQLVDELALLPWGHIRTIIDKCANDGNMALFYVNESINNNWSRAVLVNYIDSNLYERKGKAISNFIKTLPDPTGDLAQQLTKDPYNFDFLTITEPYNEKEFKDALIKNIERFLLELGKGFAYMGREFRLEIGSEEKFMDMLFYNVDLHCYVVIEVKTTKFEAGYLGQLGLYVTAVNHILKKDGDNPTIGLLVCKNKDIVVAQYALEGISLPIGISEYELSKLYPVDFKSSLPSIEEIEAELADK